MLRERNIISSQLSPDFTFSSQFYNNWIYLSLNRFLEAFTFSSQICNKSNFRSIVIRMSPKCNLAKNKDPIFVTMFNLKIAWKSTFFWHCDENGMIMCLDQKNIHHIYITFLWQSDNNSNHQISLIWLKLYQTLLLKVGHIVMKKWWKCEEFKLVLVFWHSSFEFSLLAKSQCQMPDAWISMRV